MHEPSDITNIPIDRWIDNLLQRLGGRSPQNHDRDMDALLNRGLVLDARLEVPEQVDCKVVLVDDIPLLIIQLGNPFPKTPGEPDHVGLCPIRRTYSATSQDAWGRWWISRLIVTTADPVPTRGEGVTSPGAAFLSCDKFDIFPGTRAWRTTSWARTCFWMMYRRDPQ